jgi:mono/diheme cytochrome c family protein
MRTQPVSPFFVSAIGLLQLGSPVFAQNPRSVLPPPGIADVVTLEQNWTHTEADQFYSTPQGSKLIPYTWFLALEQKGSEGQFRDSANIQRLGYLARTPNPKNPDGLPVGFTRDGDHVGFTCAACHTQQIVYGGKAYLVDGAPTLADFEQFLRALADSLDETAANAQKFQRFADRVLGMAANKDQRDELKARLNEAVAFRKGYNQRDLSRQSDTHPRFGPGRVDAIGAIFNEVSAVAAKLPDNYLPADAPVSYPFLWDTPQHDKVQWNGSVDNTVNVLAKPLFGTKYIGALGRNAGEVLGVFGAFEVMKDGLLPRGYPSSVNVPNLIDIEESVRKLWSPQWPAAFGAIHEDLRAAGEALFRTHCVECHQPIERTNEHREVKAWLQRSIGTDEAMARNFLTRRVKTGEFKDQYISVPGLATFKDQATQADLLVHSVKRVLLGGRQASFPVPFQMSASAEVYVDGRAGGRKLTGRFHSLELKDNKVLTGRFDPVCSVNGLVLTAEQKAFSLTDASHPAGRFQARDGTAMQVPGLSTESAVGDELSRLRFATPVPVGYIYKGRPLNGIWATAPYLHNGSVPNLNELLKKPSDRVKKFDVGSREFDTAKVGLKSEAGTGTFVFDTQLPGNGNGGHEYGDKVFTDDERKALIEYMKSL